MKIKSEDSLIKDVAKYYGFTSIGKFRKWLASMPKGVRLYYHDSDGKLWHTRPAIILKRVF